MVICITAKQTGVRGGAVGVFYWIRAHAGPESLFVCTQFVWTQDLRPGLFCVAPFGADFFGANISAEPVWLSWSLPFRGRGRPHHTCGA